jgi:hypothetical protein
MQGNGRSTELIAIFDGVDIGRPIQIPYCPVDRRVQ